MADAPLLEQIRKVVREEIEASEKRVTDKIVTVEQRLINTIDESQEDTIKVLSDVIHEGYNALEHRIDVIEKEVHSSKN